MIVSDDLFPNDSEHNFGSVVCPCERDGDSEKELDDGMNPLQEIIDAPIKVMAWRYLIIIIDYYSTCIQERMIVQACGT
jgi:hypothetical protein